MVVAVHRPESGIIIALVGSVAISGCAESPMRDPVTGLEPALGRHPSVIVDSLEWLDAASLGREAERRENTRAVGFLSVPGAGTWCTATLITPSVILTGAGCFATDDDLRGAQFFLRREAGITEADWAGFSCETDLLRDDALDVAVVGCDGRPGDTYGVAALRTSPVAPETELYLVEQACNHYVDRDCRPDKRVADGLITAARDSLHHDADALEGALGAPAFDRLGHELVLVHVGGAGDHHAANAGVASADILQSLQTRLPELELGRRPSVFGAPPLPPDPFEPNDVALEATEVAPGFVSSAAWVGPGDRDIFRLDAARRQVVELDLLFEHQRGDVDAAVFERTLHGVKIASAVSATDNELIRFRADITGPYYLVVFGYEGATNEYELRVR